MGWGKPMQCTIRADPHRLHSGAAMLPSAVLTLRNLSHTVLGCHSEQLLGPGCTGSARTQQDPLAHFHLKSQSPPMWLQCPIMSQHLVSRPPLAWMAFRRAKLGVSSKCRRRMPVTGQVRLPAASHRSMHRRSYVWPAVQNNCSEEMQVSAVQCMCCCAQACSPRF